MKIKLPERVDFYFDGGCDTFALSDFEEQDGRYVLKNSFESIAFSIKNGELIVFLRSPERAVRLLRLEFFGQARENVKVLGDAWERAYADLGWQKPDPEKHNPWYMAISNGSDRNRDFSGRFTECFGVKVQPNALCYWQYGEKSVTLCLDIGNGKSGTHLSERELECATILFNEYENMSAYDSLRDFCKRMSPSPKRTDHVVYGSNNWYYAYGKSSQEEIITDTEYVKRFCQGCKNPPYMVIDDGWEKNSLDAPWDKGNERFPDMAYLASYIKSRGVRPGIWVRYLADGANSGTRVLNFPEEYHIDGENALDPSHPAVLEYVKSVTKKLVGWGYELIKHDFSTVDIFGKWGFEMTDSPNQKRSRFYDNTKTSAEIVKNFYKVIEEAAGDTVIIGCNCIGHLCAGIHHLNRTGDDTSGYEFSRTVKYGVNALAFRSVQNGSFFGADADCVGITGSIPWQDNEKWIRVLSESATPFFVSCKPDVLTPEQENVLSDAFLKASVAKYDFAPLDWMETPLPTHYIINGKEKVFDWNIEP